ncbi:FecCD family ABC transporter permease [Parablautia sp. Marseille-Q6255]|uniref:FecCD family ABC transporter permease n=1 Tax=Parablautia sp. Marseille-Q6255 TaxID=3039593 RepID=UPI0024BCA2B7|nr:iron ABC transporter permease [Parablautia sp. Marseille-Q6255]
MHVQPILPTRKSNGRLLLLAALLFTGAAFFLSLCTGHYPLTLQALLDREASAVHVFLTLRLPRTVMALITGCGLGAAGMIYQMVFKNPLAAPDIIGVSSGASTGAAAAILFLHASSAGITTFAFVGGLTAVCLSLLLSRLSAERNLSSLILSGIAVNALAQAALMALKFTADPEKELASIEYWIMGSLGSVTASRLPLPLVLVFSGIAVLAVFYRQFLFLTLDEEEARMLGTPVTLLRLLALAVATLIVAAIVSITGIISFVGLLAPHTARLLTKNYRLSTFLLSGILGGALLLTADIVARSAAAGEIPVSILTSLLGAPFLLWLVWKGEKTWT